MFSEVLLSEPMPGSNYFFRSVNFLLKTSHMNLLSLLSSQFIMELTFTQAAKGVNKEMAFSTEASCQRCDGKGSEPGTKVVHCHYCNGSGMVGDMMCGVTCSCLTCLSHVLVCFALYRRR